MLVLQPNTSTEMDGPLGRFVSDGVSEINTKGVFVGSGNMPFDQTGTRLLDEMLTARA